MQSFGFIESYDDLGIYVADTYTCFQCKYRLEKEPVYIGDFPETIDQEIGSIHQNYTY